MVNSGSPIASQTMVNVNEFIYQIKEGEMKNYNWDTTTSSWVPYTGEVTLNLSGVSISVTVASGTPVGVSGAVVSIASGTPVGISGQIIGQSMSGGSESGLIVWGYGTSGQFPVQTTSGSYVSVSGAVSVTGSVQVSGAVQISGTVTANTGLSGASFSGQIVWGAGSSGQVYSKTYSGDAVTIVMSLQYRLGTMSGIALGSGNLVSGGYTSASLAASQAIYYKGAQITISSGTPASGTAFIVTLIPATGGFASGAVLTSAAFSSASLFQNPPSSPFILMSGDIINVTTVSNSNSGFTWATRICFSQ